LISTKIPDFSSPLYLKKTISKKYWLAGSPEQAQTISRHLFVKKQAGIF
jgi:hypothetical protein